MSKRFIGVVGAPVAPLYPAALSDRFLARLIDGVVVLAPGVVLGLLVSASRTGAAGDADPGVTVLVPLWCLGVLLYEFVLLGAMGGQTVGKRLRGIRVVGLDGRPVGWGAAAARVYVQAVIGACTCGVGGILFALSPLFDTGPWQRGWPDQIASTLVVRAGVTATLTPPGPAVRRR